MSNNQDANAKVLSPDPNIFYGKHTIDEEIVNPGKKFPLFERVEYPPEGGIYIYYKGMPYPRKGFPYPDAVWMNDIMKRVTVTFIKCFSKDMILPFLAFAILPWKKKIRILDNMILNYNRISKWLVQGSFLKEDRYSNPARILRRLVQSFLINLGIRELYAQEMAHAIANMIEYDDAYRLRIEDIMSETTRDNLIANPAKEIKYLLGVFKQRETAHQVIDHINTASLLVKFVFLHPKIKKAWRKALWDITDQDFKWLQLDNADRYHVLLRGDYEFTGRTFAERQEIYKDVHRRSKCCGEKVTGGLTDITGYQYEPYKCTKCGEATPEGFIFPPEVEII